jgi:hypothetical protein
MNCFFLKNSLPKILLAYILRPRILQSHTLCPRALFVSLITKCNLPYTLRILSEVVTCFWKCNRNSGCKFLDNSCLGSPSFLLPLLFALCLLCVQINCKCGNHIPFSSLLSFWVSLLASIMVESEL